MPGFAVEGSGIWKDVSAADCCFGPSLLHSAVAIKRGEGHDVAVVDI